jgi:hypothetical protein
MKTSELTRAALSWAVHKCEGLLAPNGIDLSDEYCDSLRAHQEGGFLSDWSQGGPIIEREKIKLGWVVDHWVAQKDFNYNKSFYGRDPHHPLIAALRCYVASKLGDEVEVPDDLH